MQKHLDEVDLGEQKHGAVRCKQHKRCAYGWSFALQVEVYFNLLLALCLLFFVLSCMMDWSPFVDVLIQLSILRPNPE